LWERRNILPGDRYQAAESANLAQYKNQSAEYPKEDDNCLPKVGF